jgi:hypothetical protein
MRTDAFKASVLFLWTYVSCYIQADSLLIFIAEIVLQRHPRPSRS